MIFKFTGFAKYGAKELTENNNIRVEANNENEARIKMIQRLKIILGVPATKMFDTSMVRIERVVTEQELRESELLMHKREIELAEYEAKLQHDREIAEYQKAQKALLAKQLEETAQVETVVEEQVNNDNVIEETPKKTTSKKKKKVVTEENTEDKVE